MHPYKYNLLKSNDNGSLEIVSNRELPPEWSEIEESSVNKHHSLEKMIDKWQQSCETFPVHESQVEAFKELVCKIHIESCKLYEYTNFQNALNQGIQIPPEMVRFRDIKDGTRDTTTFCFLANQEEKSTLDEAPKDFSHKLEPPSNEIKNLEYWKSNCEDNYLHTPISVLRYITELEKKINTLKTNQNGK